MALLAGTILFLLLGMTGMIFLGKSSVDTLETKDIHIDSQAALSLNGMEQISQKNGVTQWELSAQSASLIPRDNKAVLQNVHVIFYTKDQQKVILTADQGQLDTETHDMVLTDNVIITYQTACAKTHSLHYEKKNHIIRSDSQIQITQGSSFVRADSMSIDLTKNTLVFSGHVKGTLYEYFRKP